MKNIIIFFVAFIFSENLHSQTNHNLDFKDVILIGQDDVITNGKDYLINLPIFPSKEVITIYDNTWHIPPKLFFEKESFLEKQNKIILITADLEYYKAISEHQKKTGYEMHPVRQRKIYYIDRIAKTIDSTTIVEEYAKTLKYNMRKIDTKKSSLFYKQCFKSKSKDLKITSMIESFEKENNIKLHGIKNKNASCVTLSTDNLSDEQKIELLNFLTYLSKSENPNKKNPKIFLPK